MHWLGHLIKSSPDSAFSEVDKNISSGCKWCIVDAFWKTYRLRYDKCNWWPARCCVSSLLVKYKCSFTPQNWFSLYCKVHQTQNEVVRCVVRFENRGWKKWVLRHRNWVIVLLFLQFANAMINSDLVPNQPYMAYVTFIGPTFSFYGGGALISSSHVLTCAANIQGWYKEATNFSIKTFLRRVLFIPADLLRGELVWVRTGGQIIRLSTLIVPLPIQTTLKLTTFASTTLELSFSTSQLHSPPKSSQSSYHPLIHQHIPSPTFKEWFWASPANSPLATKLKTIFRLPSLGRWTTLLVPNYTRPPTLCSIFVPTI